MQEIAKTVGALVEDKLGERSQLEEQVRGMAKMAERMVADAIRTRVPKDMFASGDMATGQKVTLRLKKLEHFKGELPTYATAGASGLDVRARVDQTVSLAPGERALIPTGLSLEIPYGFEVQVRPRSGLAISKGLSLVNSPGTVDADYRGEVKVIVINLGQEAIQIADGERMAQLVVCPVIQAELVEVTETTETARGAGGFGSTGL